MNKLKVAILAFVTKLKILLLFIGVLLIMSTQSNAQISTIAVDDFEKGINQPNIQLLDVRTSGEYQNSHLFKALQADWNNEEQFTERITALDKTKPLYIYCLSGGRSYAAMQWLQKNGFTTVYNLKGGINAWKQSNKPVQEVKGNVTQISLQTYLSSIPKDKTVLVDVGAEWCPPCVKMKPVIDSLYKQNYTIINIDGGTQTDLCKALQIEAFPVFIVYKNGIEITRKQGVLSLIQLKELLK